jgi:hypothetical protein
MWRREEEQLGPGRAHSKLGREWDRSAISARVHKPKNNFEALDGLLDGVMPVTAFIVDLRD